LLELLEKFVVEPQELEMFPAISLLLMVRSSSSHLSFLEPLKLLVGTQ
jgi:hypothetical protein